jgi:hypothetical protein
MLEQVFDQGAGLRKMAGQFAPRILALASHGDPLGELPFLWRLCDSLSYLGYSLMVLDETTAETPGNPGLQDCIHQGLLPPPWVDTTGAWSVLPSKMGFSQLNGSHHKGALAFEDLAGLFQTFGVVILYLGTEALIDGFAQGDIEPVLAVSGHGSSRSSASQALERILSRTSLKATVISVQGRIMEHPVNNEVMMSPDPRIQTRSLHSNSEGSQDDEMNRLALRLLENASLFCKRKKH